jgi:hypothetical protein
VEEEEVLEEEGVDNAEEERTEPPTEEEDDVSQNIQKLTPILGYAKEQRFIVNKLQIEREKEEE